MNSPICDIDILVNVNQVGKILDSREASIDKETVSFCSVICCLENNSRGCQSDTIDCVGAMNYV